MRVFVFVPSAVVIVSRTDQLPAANETPAGDALVLNSTHPVPSLRFQE